MSSGRRGEVVFIDQVKRNARGLTGSSAFEPLQDELVSMRLVSLLNYNKNLMKSKCFLDESTKRKKN